MSSVLFCVDLNPTTIYKGDKMVMYGHITNTDDVTELNRQIRSYIRKTSSHDKITKLVRESLYLITLTYTRGWGKHLRGSLSAIRKRAKDEYTKTAKVANKKIGMHYYDEIYGDGF